MSESVDYYLSPEERGMLKRELLCQARSLRASIIVAEHEERVSDAAGLIVRVEAILDFLEQLS